MLLSGSKMSFTISILRGKVLSDPRKFQEALGNP